jgi:hypothetical protein
MSIGLDVQIQPSFDMAYLPIYLSFLSEAWKKRERGESGGSSERRHILGGVRDRHFPPLQVPRQCSLVILVQARLGEGEESGSEKGKALGSEEDEALGSGLCYEQLREVEQGLNTAMMGLFILLLERLQ